MNRRILLCCGVAAALTLARESASAQMMTSVAGGGGMDANGNASGVVTTMDAQGNVMTQRIAPDGTVTTTGPNGTSTAPPGGPGGPSAGWAGNPGGPIMNFANMDPQQIQQRMQDMRIQSFRDQLGATNDDEWAVIQERLRKVIQLRAEIANGARAVIRRAGSGGPSAGGRPPSLPEAAALQSAIENNAPDKQVADAMDRLRATKKAKQADLLRAQQDLRDVLTPHQEAVLLLAGILD